MLVTSAARPQRRASSRSGAPGRSPRVTCRHGSLRAERRRDVLATGGWLQPRPGAERQRRRERPVPAQLPGHVGAGHQVAGRQRLDRTASPRVRRRGPARPAGRAPSGRCARGQGASRRPCGMRRPGAVRSPRRAAAAARRRPTRTARRSRRGCRRWPWPRCSSSPWTSVDLPTPPGPASSTVRPSGPAEAAHGGVQRDPAALLAPPQRRVLQQDGPQQQPGPGAQHGRRRSAPAGRPPAGNDVKRRLARRHPQVEARRTGVLA